MALYVAEIVTVVEKITRFVGTVNVVLVAPAGTSTLGGTLATDGSLLESVTCTPPAGAGPFSVTVAKEGLPPVTLVGFSVSEEIIRGITVSEAVCVWPA